MLKRDHKTHEFSGNSSAMVYGNNVCIMRGSIRYMATYFEGYEIESCPRISAQGWLVKAVIAGRDEEIVCEDGNEFPTYEEAAEASFALGRRWVWSRRQPQLKL